MEADEDVGLVVIRCCGALVDRHVAIVVSRQEHADAETRLDRRFQPPRDGEGQVLFLRAARADDARIVAAVAGVDRHSANCRSGEHACQIRRCRGRGYGRRSSGWRRLGLRRDEVVQHLRRRRQPRRQLRRVHARARCRALARVILQPLLCLGDRLVSELQPRISDSGGRTNADEIARGNLRCDELTQRRRRITLDELIALVIVFLISSCSLPHRRVRNGSMR